MLLPEIRPGVIVHIHDIFLPWNYPDHWRDRGWNEACGLAPWILSGAFEIVLPVHFVIRRREADLRAAMPWYLGEVASLSGGSIWLRKK
jgi:hypothetical protein